MITLLTTAACVFGISLIAQAQAQEQAPAQTPEADAWRAVRAADCARCHGKDHEGLAAPSIVGFARTQSRERFIAAVLDGNPPMSMPAYRGNPLIESRIDAIYRYFAGRADGSIAPGAIPGRQ
ncbi:Cytochrome c-555 precursor [Caballeronia arvi]|uniref:Cytochrome c-555 n=1 Tax=Caballeronia arvi TaxID=1777135 RepID=A0A158IBR4_9BURK|nr:cytochrome c [Caballeronia arvi]SAL54018.1 Cytochrome c-555 precursor [Caballeronia arvi]